VNLFKFQPGDSVFHRLDPRVKLLLVLSVSISIFTVNNLVMAAGAFLSLLLIWKVCGLPLRNLAKMFRVLIFLFVFITAVQAFFFPGRIIIIPLGTYSLTLEGILHGVMISLRVSILLSMIPLLTLTTETEDMVLGLVKVKLPYKYAYMATTALNMVPTFTEEYEAIKNAQLLRACTIFEEGKFKDKLRGYPSLVVPLVIGAMRRAQSMGVAMDARSFAVTKRRTYIRELVWQKRDTIGCILVVAAVCAMIVGNSLLNQSGIGVYAAYFA